MSELPTATAPLFKSQDIIFKLVYEILRSKPVPDVGYTRRVVMLIF